MIAVAADCKGPVARYGRLANKEKAAKFMAAFKISLSKISDRLVDPAL